MPDFSVSFDIKSMYRVLTYFGVLIPAGNQLLSTSS